MEDKAPNNIAELKKKAADKTSYETRLEAVDELGKHRCQQSKDILWRLMINDLAHGVQHRAFLKLQAFGEEVRLPRKKKGHLIKDINKKLAVVDRAMPASYTQEDFNAKFKELYPEAFDVYSFEKKGGFDKWIQNVLSSLPKS